MTTTTRNLGLFPLNLVLLPGERIPLHIFEPRYRALLADCTLDGLPFVLPLATDEGVARFACTASVDTVVRRFADGRVNIVVRGGERIEIVEQTDGEPYLTAAVTPIPDEDPRLDTDVVRRISERFRKLASHVAGAPTDPPDDNGVPLSYRIAGTMQLPAGTKQRLLEERSEGVRLTLVEAIIGLALRQVGDDGEGHS